MDIQTIQCPSCASALNINNNDEFVNCEFCGNTVHIKRRMVNSDGTISFVDKANNIVVASAVLPFGYEPIGMIVPNLSTAVYPITLLCSAYNKNGTILSYFTGEGYTDRSQCPMLSGPYSGAVNELSHVAYKNFKDAESYMEEYIQNYAASSKATYLMPIEEREYPLYGGFNQQECLELYKRRISHETQMDGLNESMMRGYYQKAICRVYDIVMNDVKYKVAVALVLEGFKYKVSFPGMEMMDLGANLMKGIGSLLGGNKQNGIFGQMGNQFGANQYAQPTPNNTETPFGFLSHNEVIEWQSNGVFLLQSLPENFENDFKTAFTDLCSTFRVDKGILERSYNMKRQFRIDVANYTQQNIAQQQRQFAAWQQINQTMQSAYDSYNQAWWDRNNSSYQSSRARYSDYSSSSSADFSEAIRGVNTYVRDDGTEVEVSVSYDRAYSNGLGDTLASNSAFEPGGPWNEMHKK